MKHVLIYSFCIFFISCEKNKNIYWVKGTVQSVKPELNKVIIAHDTIPDFMMPMVMPFLVKNKKEMEFLRVSDSIHFQLVWDDIKPYARDFEVVGQGKLIEEDDFFDDEFSEKNIGNIIDDGTFLDVDNKVVKLSDSDGRYRFISYIFSRCPMPNMCPAIVMKNRYLADNFPEVDFIMVSFDYKYDTPNVLNRAYGLTIGDYNNWYVWSSSGYIDDVYKLIRQSGGNFWGVEKDKIGHSLSSILIGPKREILGVWKGDEWEANQVENAIILNMQ